MFDSQIPLAERMRPTSFGDFIGQEHLVGKNGALSKLLTSGVLPSMIFWGPPGVGKTTLAKIIANSFDRDFFQLNAISSGVKDIREIIERAEKSGFMGTFKKPIVFIDEIHRFNKSQQDSLLAAVEKGIICLIGATTENPSFEVISALLSRCQLFTLKELTPVDLKKVLEQAIEKDEWLKLKKINLEEVDALIILSGGDARKLLNFLEVTVSNLYHLQEITITNEVVKNSIQQSAPVYDKNGEMHYDIISAFIKSIRGSDPDATLYWMARMLHGGEDPVFIARRMLIASSEDIGNANPNALLLTTSTFQAVQMIGMPEAEIILGQCAVYLASSPKSNASYKAIKMAVQFVKENPSYAVPLHLRNAPTGLMKDLNYGVGYKYAHDYPGNFVLQNYKPEEMKNIKFYLPGENPRENEMKKYLDSKWSS